MAAPHVAGTAALVIISGIADSNSNGRINDDVRLRLQQTAENLGLPSTWVGHGLVDAAAAVVSSSPPSPPPPGSGSSTLTVTDGYDEKEEATLQQLDKTGVVQGSDNDWWETEEGRYTSFEFSNVSIPTGATLTSVLIYVEHWEEEGFNGKVEWSAGTGWPNGPTVWDSIDTIALH